MNKTVFLMDTAGNAVQWAAGMSLEPKEVGGVVWVCVGPSTYTIHTADPHACISHFVRALCACPDESLLEWDEESGMVGCKTWIEPPAPVATPEPSLLPDGRPVIPVPGHTKWRELYEDEVIQEGDRVSASESFDLSVVAIRPWQGKHLRSYRLAGDEYKTPYGKVYRRINPKKQKKAGGAAG